MEQFFDLTGNHVEGDGWDFCGDPADYAGGVAASEDWKVEIAIAAVHRRDKLTNCRLFLIYKRGNGKLFAEY